MAAIVTLTRMPASTAWGTGLRYAVPLTTIWTPPAGCDRIVTFQANRADDGCAPPEYEAVWYNNGYYSPGICPSGYTVGCTASGPSMNYEPIKAGETAAICVPSSYSCLPLNAQRTDYAASILPLTESDEVRASTTSVPAFQIRWKDSDLTLLATPPVTASGLTTVTATATPGATTVVAGPTAGASSSTGGSALSVGAIAGIAVGGGVAVILAGLAVAFFVWRGRKKTAVGAGPQFPQASPVYGAPAGFQYDVPKGVGYGFPAVAQANVQAWPHQELHGTAATSPVELDSPRSTDSPVSELPGYYSNMAGQR